MKKFFPTKTFLLIIVLALITGFLLFLALRIQKNQVSISTPTVTEILPQTDISLLEPTASKTAKLKSEFKSEIQIDTGQNKVTTVQLELSYNPKVLGSVDIASGSFFLNPTVLLKKIDPVGGTISYALSASDEKGISGKGILAILTFTPVAGQSGETQISFLPKTQVTAENLLQSALKSTTAIVFSLGPTLMPSQPPASAAAK